MRLQTHTFRTHTVSGEACWCEDSADIEASLPLEPWTRALAFWNTVSTLIGGVASWVAVIILIYLEFLR